MRTRSLQSALLLAAFILMSGTESCDANPRVLTVDIRGDAEVEIVTRAVEPERQSCSTTCENVLDTSKSSGWFVFSNAPFENCPRRSPAALRSFDGPILDEAEGRETCFIRCPDGGVDGDEVRVNLVVLGAEGEGEGEGEAPCVDGADFADCALDAWTVEAFSVDRGSVNDDGGVDERCARVSVERRSDEPPFPEAVARFKLTLNDPSAFSALDAERLFVRWDLVFEFIDPGAGVPNHRSLAFIKQGGVEVRLGGSGGDYVEGSVASESANLNGLQLDFSEGADAIELGVDVELRAEGIGSGPFEIRYCIDNVGLNAE